MITEEDVDNNYHSRIAKIFPFVMSLIYDIVMISYLFVYGSLYYLTDPLIINIFLFQIFLGFFYKSAATIFVLTDIESLGLSCFSLLQIISYFIGIVGLQGIGLIMLQNLTLCFCFFIWKAIKSLIEAEVIMRNGLYFFGCRPQDTYFNRLLSFLISISNFPVDYAPFYNLNNLKSQFLDFKFTQVTTQVSLTIVRAGQVFDSLLMLALVKLGDFVPEQNDGVQGYYKFVLVCILFNTLLSLYHICKRYIAYKNKSFDFFESIETSYDDLKIILKNSVSARYLKINQVRGLDKLNPEYSRNDTSQQQSWKNERKEILENFLKISNSELIQIHIQGGYLINNNSNIQVKGEVFFDEVLELVENERELKSIQIAHNLYGEIEETKFQCAIFNRIYKFGIDEHLIKFTTLQQTNLNTAAKKIINGYQANILSFKSFEKCIQPYLLTNPNQVYYDLYEIELI